MSAASINKNVLGKVLEKMSYKFTDREIEEICICKKNCSDRRVLQRLEVLKMRTEGHHNKEISEITGYHIQYITVLVSRYKNQGLDSIL